MLKYVKTRRRYRRLLRKQAKQWQPYDYNFLVDMVHVGIEGMAAYYTGGDNVITKDEHDERLKICQEWRVRYDRYQRSQITVKELMQFLADHIDKLWD